MLVYEVKFTADIYLYSHLLIISNVIINISGISTRDHIITQPGPLLDKPLQLISSLPGNLYKPGPLFSRTDVYHSILRLTIINDTADQNSIIVEQFDLELDARSRGRVTCVPRDTSRHHQHTSVLYHVTRVPIPSYVRLGISPALVPHCTAP